MNILTTNHKITQLLIWFTVSRRWWQWFLITVLETCLGLVPVKSIPTTWKTIPCGTSFKFPSHLHQKNVKQTTPLHHWVILNGNLKQVRKLVRCHISTGVNKRLENQVICPTWEELGRSTFIYVSNATHVHSLSNDILQQLQGFIIP